MKIIGVDVGGGKYATAHFLESIPSDPKEYIKTHQNESFQVNYNSEDLEALFDLNPDCVVLEPTGGYEAIILEWCRRKGVEFRLANTARLATYRNDLGIPKTDRNDGFALACFGIAKWDDLSAWVRPIELAELRELLFNRRQLLSQRRSLINQFRQRLHNECPETKNFEQRRYWREPALGLFRYCAGVKNKQQVAWEKRIGSTCGSGLSPFTRAMGERLYWIDAECIDIEGRIDQLLEEERFTAYKVVFEEFGFSQHLSAWWLTRIYPFDQFLDENGKAIKEIRMSRHGKVVTYHRSISRFKCILGAGTIPNTSGIRGETPTRYKRRKQSKNRKEPEYYVVGDRYCREAFVMWFDRRIVTNVKLNSICTELRERYEQQRKRGKPYYKILGNLHGYCAKRVFKALLKSLQV